MILRPSVVLETLQIETLVMQHIKTFEMMDTSSDFKVEYQVIKDILKHLEGSRALRYAPNTAFGGIVVIEVSKMWDE